MVVTACACEVQTDTVIASEGALKCTPQSWVLTLTLLGESGLDPYHPSIHPSCLASYNMVSFLLV